MNASSMSPRPDELLPTVVASADVAQVSEAVARRALGPQEAVAEATPVADEDRARAPAAVDGPAAEGEVPPACEAAPEQPEAGDLVILGPRAPPEFRQHLGVVTKVAKAHCTVVVLDESRRFGIGECWPCFEDLEIDSRLTRLDSRVVIDGLQSARANRLNGFSGTICSHPSRGHPIFINKPSAPDRPQFFVCVSLDDPAASGEKSVLLEPRFLASYDTYVARTTGELAHALASLRKAGGTSCGAATRSDAGNPSCAVVPS